MFFSPVDLSEASEDDIAEPTVRVKRKKGSQLETAVKVGEVHDVFASHLVLFLVCSYKCIYIYNSM